MFSFETTGLSITVAHRIFFVCVVTQTLISGCGSSEVDALRLARQAMQRQNFEAAVEHASEFLHDDSTSIEASMIAARSAFELHQFEQAIDFLDGIQKSDEQEFLAAQTRAAEIEILKTYRLSKAEARCRLILELQPDHEGAHQLLSYILGFSGRYWEQIPYRLRMISKGHIEPEHLLSLSLGADSLENAETAKVYHQAAPDDPLPLVSMARVEIEKQNFDVASDYLQRAIEIDPSLLIARIQLGQLLLKQNEDAQLVALLQSFDKTVNQHPEVWKLWGDWYSRQLRPNASIRCYAEAIRLDPNDSHTNYQLGRLLGQVSTDEIASPFLNRAATLRTYVNQTKVAVSRDDDLAIRDAAETAEQLGLIWEAYAWSGVTLSKRDEHTQWRVQLVSRIQSQLGQLPLQRCRPEDNPIQSFHWEQYPLPQETELSTQKENFPIDIFSHDWDVAFVNDAANVGLNFQYFNGSVSNEDGLERMFEFAGGGVVVLDYDCDGWPDLYFPQGSSWPPNPDQNDTLDRLFRNSGEGRFIDVTVDAGLCENRFSHGAATGDFNSDGWPDLFVSNIGVNRLYLNNSDGTFTDVTQAAGISDESWTTSCAMADLNADGHPDLYAVNYLHGENIFSRVCGDESSPGICLPQRFSGALDQCLINDGQGNFVDVTSDGELTNSEGKGLGIIATKFAPDHSLEVFVANDTTPNFLYRLDEKSAAGLPVFQEHGMLAGVALNGEGKTEACMGVAVGDIDRNGLQDLFVTNFYSESNTLFLQIQNGFFEDRTVQAGLDSPSRPLVGFGTQTIDANLDGWLDLIVANGHIDHHHVSTGPAYQMPPQFYLNHQGKFDLVNPEILGEYFQGNYLGRGLARCDWNQDDREDVVITHLDAPVALLTNTSLTTHSCFTIRLVGTNSNRDAIGATISVETATGCLVKVVSAGDGYLASNERTVCFGLGTAKVVNNVTITWPEGHVDQFENLPANSRWIAIEGRPKLYPVPSRSL